MLNVTHIIESGGLLLIGFMVFAESGMLLGFFLPGDTLVFTAGFFAGIGKLPLPGLIAVVILAAIAGDNTGFQIGKSAGHKLFRKKDGLIFRQSYVQKSEVFYEKHGGKTILLAQFFPIVRTFVPVVAGISHMPRKKFIVFNAVGVVVWGTGIVLLGDWLGSKIPNIDKYLLPVVGAAILISFGPTIWHVAKALLERRRAQASTTKDKS